MLLPQRHRSSLRRIDTAQSPQTLSAPFARHPRSPTRPAAPLRPSTH